MVPSTESPEIASVDVLRNALDNMATLDYRRNYRREWKCRPEDERSDCTDLEERFSLADAINRRARKATRTLSVSGDLRPLAHSDWWV